MEQCEYKTMSRRSSVRTTAGIALVLAQGAAGLGCMDAELSTPEASPHTLTGSSILTGPVLVIDDFTTGPGTHVETGVAIQNFTQSGTGILGGTRCVTLGVNSNPLGRPVEVEIRNGENNYLALDSGVKVTQFMMVRYGTNNQCIATGLDVDLSNYQEFRIDYVALDLGTGVEVEVYSIGGGVSSAPLSVQPGVNFTRHIPFSSLSGNVDWRHVRIVLFEFSSGGVVPAHDYAINGISAGPAS